MLISLLIAGMILWQYHGWSPVLQHVLRNKLIPNATIYVQQPLVDSVGEAVVKRGSNHDIADSFLRCGSL